ncbi:MAG TPA: ornithine carbamoyltransferase [Anaerolineales bacterium]|nr:ornithine carbamoyltransferase [Anaerolineales bacterium]
MQHFLDITDFSRADLEDLLQLAVELKREHFAGGNRPVLRGKVLAMVFQKPSLRTRVSFDMGMRHLGGDALYLSPAEIGLGKRESVADVARVLSGYCQAIMARVFQHEHILQLAQYASVPVINGLSDASHPCQALADVLTIQEKFGKVEGLTVTFVGDGNNVARSLMQACVILGANFRIATPPGYEMAESDLENARKFATAGATVSAFIDPIPAVENADVLYTDVWTSMGQEAETAQRLQVFPPYQLNSALVSHASRDAQVLHCLPAHRGEEITDEVADGRHSWLFPQAENRMHAQKAVLHQLLAN